MVTRSDAYEMNKSEIKRISEQIILGRRCFKARKCYLSKVSGTRTG